MSRLNFVNQSSVAMPKKFLTVWFDAVVDQLPAKDKRAARNREVTIVFLNLARAKALNLQYRGRAYATDVLSFMSEERESLGDLVICPQVVTRQAKEHGLSFRAELAYMSLHGLLHLLGYDHEETQAEAQRMFRLQDRLFSRWWAITWSGLMISTS